MLALLPFPEIDPVAVQLGPVAIRWYALSYIAGLVLGWLYMRRMAAHLADGPSRRQVDDFLFWAAIGTVLGGRIGYVLFYQPGRFLDDPLSALALWEGGMSFHGGFLGVVVATILFARSNGIAILRMGDLVAGAAPIGIFFGRLANFVNGELWGRPSDVPWAMVFPTGGPVPRHPSQLYEALLEGLVLFLVLHLVARSAWARARPGTVIALFLAGYGLARSAAEFFREPDAFLGFLAGGVTMGQVLSLPMILTGLALLWWLRARKPG